MGATSITYHPQVVFPFLINMDRLFTCELCNRSFTQSSTLEQHKQSHEEKRPYKCIYCDKSFQSYSQLSKHVGVSESDPKAHKCSFCCLSFAEATCLAVHVMTHTDDKPYKCQFCGESFANSSYANHHEKSHFADKTHKCGLCYRTYSDAAQLAKHFRVHTGVYQFFLTISCGFFGKFVLHEVFMYIGKYVPQNIGNMPGNLKITHLFLKF